MMMMMEMSIRVHITLARSRSRASNGDGPRARILMGPVEVWPGSRPAMEPTLTLTMMPAIAVPLPRILEVIEGARIPECLLYYER